jgi:hypothetical protein
VSEDLQRDLRALATQLHSPPAPDVAATVLEALPPRRRVRATRRTVALAVAALLLIAGGAFALPATRNRILRGLGLRGVEIVRVPRLPPVAPGTGTRLALGRRISLHAARHAAGFTALLPPAASAAYVGHDIAGGRISVLVGPILMTEFRASLAPTFEKLVGPGTQARAARVGDHRGAWIDGAAHVVLFEQDGGAPDADRPRLAGNVLVWQQGALTISIEGAHTLARARALARTLR